MTIQNGEIICKHGTRPSYCIKCRKEDDEQHGREIDFARKHMCPHGNVKLICGKCTPQYDTAWIAVLREKISDLELIASWATVTQFGNVRDHCRQASFALSQEIDRIKGNAED